MGLDLVADHIRQEREAEVAHAALERLVAREAPATGVGRLRLAAARALISVGQALGGESLRTTRPARLPARRAG